MVQDRCPRDWLSRNGDSAIMERGRFTTGRNRAMEMDHTSRIQMPKGGQWRSSDCYSTEVCWVSCNNLISQCFVLTSLGKPCTPATTLARSTNGNSQNKSFLLILLLNLVEWLRVHNHYCYRTTCRLVQPGPDHVIERTTKRIGPWCRSRKATMERRS